MVFMATGDKKEISVLAIIRNLKWKNTAHVFKYVKVSIDIGNNPLKLF